MDFDTFCNQLRIEKDKVLPRFLNREDMYIKYCNLFLEDATFAGIQSVMEQYIAGKTEPTEVLVEKLRRLFHTLKGVVGSLGFMQLFTLADDVVKLMCADGSAEEKLSQVGALYAEIEKEYRRICLLINLNQGSADDTTG
ncbi:MAG: hypothetical protein E7269_06720 [Lachnospiraceae bacterium]|nr:hypothetical protein [Lachnospiraceae bacterium]